MDIKERISGALYGAAIGDAMALPTDGLDEHTIRSLYGGDVIDIIKPHEKSFSPEKSAGEISDAFSIPLFIIEDVCSKQALNRSVATDALIRWSNSKYSKFAGMTTQKVIENLKNEDSEDQWAFAGRLGSRLYVGHYYALSSNGSLKSWISPLFVDSGQDVQKSAIEICMSSHDDILSLSAAVSVTSAMQVALQGGNVEDIFDASLDGALSGLRQAQDIKDLWDYPGPSPYKRLAYAKKCAYTVRAGAHARSEFRDVIGCGPEVAETLPLALGLLLAHKDCPINALIDAVNIGDETCATASLVGAFLGAANGADFFNSEWQKSVDGVNSFRLSEIAQTILEMKGKL